MTLLVGGATRASPALLIVPLENDSSGRARRSRSPIGVNILLYGLIGPFAAAMMETFGVRRMMLGALAAIGAGIALTPLMQQSWQLVVLWGVIVGAGAGVIANVLAATIAARWFTDTPRARDGAPHLVGRGGSASLPAVPRGHHRRLRLASRCRSSSRRSCSFCLFRSRSSCASARRTWASPLWRGAGHDRPAAARDPAIRCASRSPRLGTGLRSRDFWLLAGSFFVCGASTNGLIGTHLVAACSDKGMSEVAAASMLAMMAIFNFVGATGSGWLSDRMDNRVLLAIYYGLRGLSLLLLPFAFDSFYMLGLFIVFYGLDWIATVPPTVRLTANVFGKDNTGLMFGWISASHQLGGATAAYLAGVIRVDLGNYTQAFIISGVLCFVAAMLVMFIGRAPSRPAVVGSAANAGAA